MDPQPNRRHNEGAIIAVELKLEPVSEEQEYATIARWRKREGDAVSRGEVIVEVEAEKVTQEVESPVTGVLESILAAEGDEIRVGTVIAVIVERAEAA